jgi:hypothetical protein
MSGCGDDNPDDERREAARDNTKSVSRGADDGRGGLGSRSLRAAVVPDQSAGEPTRGEGSHPWQPGTTWSLPVQLRKKPQPSTSAKRQLTLDSKVTKAIVFSVNQISARV